MKNLATRRTPTNPVPVRYDETTQTSQVYEDGMWVSSWLSTQIPNSKKADLETGEDQKGQ